MYTIITHNKRQKGPKGKRDLRLATRLWNKFKEISLFWIIWPSLMMQYKAVFELFQKWHLQIYASQFMTSYIMPWPFVLLNLEIVERKEKDLQKFEYLENEKRTFFIVFEGLSFGEKIKLWLKTVDTSFMYVTHVILSGFYAADSTHQYLVFSNS